MESRLYRRSNKSDMFIVKEISYILLFITFFIGILAGSLSFSNVSNFEQYENSLKESLILQVEGKIEAKNSYNQGLKLIVMSWIIGMSVIGIPFLAISIGYRGYSIRIYHISDNKNFGCYGR